jgi:hypothetical protein
LAQSSSSLLSLIHNKSQLTSFSQIDSDEKPNNKTSSTYSLVNKSPQPQVSENSRANFELAALRAIKKLDLEVPVLNAPTRGQQEPRFNSLEFFLNRNSQPGANNNSTNSSNSNNHTNPNINNNKTTIKKIKIKKKKNNAKSSASNSNQSNNGDELQIDRITLSNRSSSLSTLSAASLQETSNHQTSSSSNRVNQDYELSASFRVNPNASAQHDKAKLKDSNNKLHIDELSQDFSVRFSISALKKNIHKLV